MRFISFSNRLISTFVFNARVVVDLPILFRCIYSTGRFAFDLVGYPKTDVLAITHADQCLLISAKQLLLVCLASQDGLQRRYLATIQTDQRCCFNAG